MINKYTSWPDNNIVVWDEQKEIYNTFLFPHNLVLILRFNIESERALNKRRQLEERSCLLPGWSTVHRATSTIMLTTITMQMKTLI